MISDAQMGQHHRDMRGAHPGRVLRAAHAARGDGGCVQVQVQLLFTHVQRPWPTRSACAHISDACSQQTCGQRMLLDITGIFWQDAIVCMCVCVCVPIQGFPQQPGRTVGLVPRGAVCAVLANWRRAACGRLHGQVRGAWGVEERQQQLRRGRRGGRHP